MKTAEAATIDGRYLRNEYSRRLSSARKLARNSSCAEKRRLVRILYISWHKWIFTGPAAS